MQKIIIGLFVLLVNFSLYSQKIHTPEEIIVLMTNSSTKYMLNSLDKKIECEDNSSNVLGNDYYRTGEGKDIKILKYDIKNKTREYLNTAESYFSKLEFEDALEYYTKSYKSDTTTFFNLTFMGQCNGLLKKYDEAIKYYKLAIKYNYIDYMAHWFLADIYAEKEKWQEASKEITIAQVLNRNNPRLQNALISIYKKAGLKWEDFCFNPQYKLKNLGKDSVSVKFDLVWMMYAMVKSVWAYEKGYRESRGEKNPQFSVLEEWEALSILNESLIRSDKDISKIPELSVLKKSIKNDLLDAYIFFEIISVKYPFSAYNLSKESIEKIADYVIRIRCGN